MYDDVPLNAIGHEYMFEKLQFMFIPTTNVQHPIKYFKILSAKNGIRPKRLMSPLLRVHYMQMEVFLL